ncbi:IAA-alanine resistance protein 1-like [Chenopodium quinoa]|uniref:IAA-alanine resistance protein 1-like n=1 Tax=Chenopodium quinoa TaxID=63459 RepID=UPI000B790542|nr:IAA-alanine resistance protein 1-like [Chenopodium quinoa]
MAVQRSKHILLLLLLVTLLDLCIGHQSPASHHGCSHDHHHHHDQENTHHHHHHHHNHDEIDQSVDKRKLLPEELAEEEDLKLYGFGSDNHHHHHHHEDHLNGSHLQLSGIRLWINAMGCSLLVSLASLICLTIVPILCANGKPSKAVVDALAIFGAGAMLGDAFLHQLPHAFSGGHSHSHDEHAHSEESHSHSHAHSLKDLSIGLSVLSGIVVFLIVEKIVRYVEEISGGEHSGTHSHHHHRHNKSSKKVKDDDDIDEKSSEKPSKEKKLNGAADATSKSKQGSGSQTELKKRNKNANTNDDKSDIDAADRKVGEAKPAKQPSNLVFGYLNLFSDAVHNFTDGMALGSAFLLYGSVGGWSRTIFLLAHEIPQEVGDFGILVRSGFSVSKALFFNFLSALVALAGTALALLLGQDPGQSSLIEGFTAGGFIYISVAGVLAEMNNNGSPGLKSSVSQLISLILGMAVALWISLVE